MNFDSLLNSFDFAIIIMLALGALFGFLRGLFKSAYKLLVFLILLAAGWFLSPIIVRYLMDFDISSVQAITFESETITSINESIPILINSFVPELAGMVEPGTVAYATVQSVIFMVLRIAVLIVWLILMGTVFKFIFWIIYLIIKPKRRKGAKKGILSRLGGLGIGLCHTLIIIFLFSILLSGLTSMGNALVELLPEGAGPVLQETAEAGEEPGEEPGQQEGGGSGISLPDLENFASVFELMSSYRETLMGKIAGAAKFKGVPGDEFFFDEMFSLKVKKPEVQIKIRKELLVLVRVYALIGENLEGEITPEALTQLDEEVLETVISEIRELKILNVAVPIGVEYARKAGLIDFMDDEEFEEAFEEILELDFGEEFAYLVQAYLQVVDLGLLSGEQPDFLALDPEKVEELFQTLANLQLVELAGNIGFNYLMGLEGTQNFLNDIGVDPESIVIQGISWRSELGNIGTLYRAFRELGLTFEDGKPYLGSITDEGINSFSEAVFNSKIFADNAVIFGRAVINMLPDDFKDLITVESLVKNDLASLLTLAKVLYDAGLLGDEINYETLFSEETIERIAEAVSNSNLLSSNLGRVLKTLLEQVELPFELAESTLERDWSGASGKREIKALLSAAGELMDLGLKDGDFFENLTTEKIDSLADKIAESSVLMGNMGNLIDYLFSEGVSLGDISISTDPVKDMDWESQAGRDEFKSIMRAMAAIFEGNLHQDPDFDNLSDGTEDVNGDGKIDDADNLIKRLAESMSGSVLIRHNLNNLIDQIAGEATGDVKIAMFDDPDDWTSREIQALLRSVKIISKKENIPEDLFNLTNEELDIILSSTLICKSLVENLKGMTAEDGQLKDFLIIQYVGADDWYDRYDEDGERIFDGELRKLFNSGRILLGDNPDFDNPEGLISLSTVLDLSDEDIDGILASQILKASFANQLIKLSREEDAQIVVKMEMGDPGWEAEIRSLIDSVKVLLGDEADLENLSIDPNTLKNLSEEDIDTVLASTIISDTIIRKLVEIGQEADGALVVRFDEDDPAWKASGSGAGELRHFISAAILILDEEDDLNSGDAVKVNKIAKLAEADVDVLVQSYILVDTAVKHLRSMTAPDGGLHEVLYLPDLTDDDYYGSSGEMKRFILAAKHLLDASGEDVELEELSTIKLGTLAGENKETILASEIVKETIIRNIEKEAEKEDSVVKLPPELVRTESDKKKENWDDEIPKLLDAIIVILGEDSGIDDVSFDESRFLALTDPEISTLVASRLISFTAVKTIEEKAEDEDSLIALPGELNPESGEYQEELWYGENGELAKALKALASLGIASFDTGGFDEKKFLSLSDETINAIAASRVISYTAVKTIQDNAKDENSILALPDELNPESGGYQEELWYGENGELAKALRAVRALEISSFDTDGFEQTKFLSLSDAQIDAIVASRVLSFTAVKTIEDNAKDDESLIALPDVLNSEKAEYDESLWYGANGELAKVLKALKALNLASFESDFSLQAVFEEAKGPAEDEVILASKVIEATFINKIEKEAAGSLAGTLIIPEDVVWERSGGDRGELRRFLIAIEVIIGEADLSTAEFDVDKFLGLNQNKLLDSSIVEASAIHFIINSDKLIIPHPADQATYYFFENETIVWEGEDGELRRFLAGIESILGTDSFATLTFTMDKFMEVDFELALRSRVLEATLADMVGGMISGPLNGMIKEPDNGYHWFHHATCEAAQADVRTIRRGEFVLPSGANQYSDLSGFLKAIQKFLDSGLNYENVNKYTIADADTQLLAEAMINYSRVIRGSIATLLNKALEDVDHPLKPEFSEEDFENATVIQVKAALDAFSLFVKTFIS